MPSKSIAEAYILRAIQLAQFEQLEDGTVTAWVPDFPGLIALGPDGKACLNDLWRRLEEWIQASFEEGLQLPVLGDIDLNNPHNRKLAGYHQYPRESKRGRIFESDEEFISALKE